MFCFPLAVIIYERHKNWTLLNQSISGTCTTNAHCDRAKQQTENNMTSKKVSHDILQFVAHTKQLSVNECDDLEFFSICFKCNTSRQQIGMI